MNISEIQIIPIKPQNGLVAFVSFLLDEWLYLGSIGIYTKLDGGYRLTYPSRKSGIKDFSIFHPIHQESAQLIEQTIINKYEEVMKGNHDRYSCTHTT